MRDSIIKISPYSLISKFSHFSCLSQVNPTATLGLSQSLLTSNSSDSRKVRYILEPRTNWLSELPVGSIKLQYRPWHDLAFFSQLSCSLFFFFCLFVFCFTNWRQFFSFLIDDKMRHNIVKLGVEIASGRQVISTANFDNFMTKFIINNRTDE